MDHHLLFILFVIFLAYVFDFINGFHDAANSIATIVTTGVLTPRQAVIWAAFFNLIAFAFFHLMVAKTVGDGLINPNVVNAKLIFAALISAIFWNLLTWYYGLPSSSSQALIGGLAGAAASQSGLGALKLSGFIKVGLGIILTPAAGLLIGYLIVKLFFKLSNTISEKNVNTFFKGLQLMSSAMLSLTHGANDAQKTMGIIAILLATWFNTPFHVPAWVVISCQITISLGTLMGGWRIVQTMGTKITQLNSLRGSAAETGAAAMIFAATEYGVPVSTTQTVTGAIAGVGLANGIKNTHWPMLKLILLSWLFTIPATGSIAALIMFIWP